MKKYLVTLLAAAALAACNDKNKGDDNSGTGSISDLVFVENGVNYLGDGDQHYRTPSGEYRLDAGKVYVLRGWVYIRKGSKLYIPAGTVIKGLKSNDVKGSSLIIEPGAQIFAEGTENAPVVFTSDRPAGQRKPGDWGGVIICGNAVNNKGSMQIEGGPTTVHGGTDNADNSGIFRYVRIEFAGYPFNTDQEINGLTLGSVGSGTQVDHVQVSYSNDDSFEFFGGAVDCKYLIAWHGWDDDFDTDNGFRGKLQFLLGVRHPKLADASCSNGFESDNNADATNGAPYTEARFCNVTLVGPTGQDAGFINTATTDGSDQSKYINGGGLFPGNNSKLGQFQAGMQIRRNSHISVSNALVMGYPVGLIVEDDKVAGTQAYATANNTLQNIVFAGYTDNAAGTVYDNAAAGAAPILGSDWNKGYRDSDGSYSGSTFTPGAGLSVSHGLALTNGCRVATLADVMLPNAKSVIFSGSAWTVNTAQSYVPQGGSSLLGAFSVPVGFDAAGSGYIGAFGATDWTANWTCFDPQNKAY
ncbi:MAG: lipoprotein [Rikenellaceae bacterium]|jgi:hypothetical protein|nr:lipoprotein [Rikenellaceae bacterium]